MLDKLHNIATCNKCSWVHFEVTPDHVSNWNHEWARYYPTLDQKSKEMYGLDRGPPSVDGYYKCFCCGNNYLDFHRTTEEEYPSGSTLQPILGRQYECPKIP